MKIVSEFKKHCGIQQPPKRYIVDELCSGIASEISNLIDKGVIEIEDIDEMTKRLTIDINLEIKKTE